jgi:hypothetical protein
MQESVVGVEKIRDDLKAKRNLVFANFSNDPSDIRLALEIKLLDDQISDLNTALSIQRRSDSKSFR